MRRDALIVGAVVLVVRLLTFPRTAWEADELRFPFALMVGLSIAASAVTAIALARVFGAAASILFSCSAAVLVHGATGRPDALAWMFLALAFVNLRAWPAATTTAPIVRGALHGVLCGTAILCQPEYLLSGVALFFAAAMLVLKERRERAVGAGVFFGILLLVVIVYGVVDNLPWDVGPLNVVRFTLHPWGSKWIAIPLLFCFALGFRRVLREWNPGLEVLMWLAFVHTAVGVAIVGEKDGARWSVPAMMFVAVVAARAGWIGTIVIAALSFWYTAPILRHRVTRPSPPVQAARAVPPGTVVLFEWDRWPGVAGTSLRDGLQRYLDRPDVPLVVFAFGNSNAPDARVFSRDEHDPYGKITSIVHRHVSLIPLGDRYLPLHGVLNVERNEAGESWRWLEPDALLRFPRGKAHARVELRLPADAPMDTTAVRVNGVPGTVRRGATTVIDVRLSGPFLTIQSSRGFQQVASGRRVSAQLMRVETR